MVDDQQRRLAKQIVDRAGLARGVIVLDEDVAALASALKRANIKVVDIPPAGMPPARIRQVLLPHRILVTRKPEDFVEEAPVYEYGIVSLAKLKVIDTSPSFPDNKTAKLISQAISANGLWTKGAKFLLELADNGKHTLSLLE